MCHRAKSSRLGVPAPGISATLSYVTFNFVATKRTLIVIGERYPTNAHKQFLLRLLVSLHVSASRCHLQGVTVSLFIT
jgi:hypothetical protein